MANSNTKRRARQRARAKFHKNLAKHLEQHFPDLCVFPPTPEPTDPSESLAQPPYPFVNLWDQPKTQHCDTCHFDFVDLEDHKENLWSQCNGFPGLTKQTCKICVPAVDPFEVNPALEFVDEPVVQLVARIILYLQGPRFSRVFLIKDIVKVFLLFVLFRFFFGR